jgi:hypothetical protein
MVAGHRVRAAAVRHAACALELPDPSAASAG